MKETREISTPLTEAELVEFGNQLANLDFAIDDNERDREAIVAAKKAELASLDTLITGLYQTRKPVMDAVRTKTKKVSVEAEWILNHDTMVKKLTAEDGTVIEEQAMTEKERQMSIEDEIRRANRKEDDDEYKSTTVASPGYHDIKAGDMGAYGDFGRGMITEIDEVRVVFLPDDTTKRKPDGTGIGFDREEFERRFVRDQDDGAEDSED